MNKSELRQIAWLFPVAYLFHLVDEYFTGLPKWFSEVLKADLSLSDFIFINSIGFTATVAVTILYAFNKINHFIIATLGTLFFVNGVVHIAATIFTLSYSPGTISGSLLYLPLGYLIYKKIFPLLTDRQKSLSIAAGFFIQIIVAIIALSV